MHVTCSGPALKQTHAYSVVQWSEDEIKAGRLLWSRVRFRVPPGLNTIARDHLA